MAAIAHLQEKGMPPPLVAGSQTKTQLIKKAAEGTPVLNTWAKGPYPPGVSRWSLGPLTERGQNVDSHGYLAAWSGQCRPRASVGKRWQ
jgi:hypothetical protein